MCFNPLILFSGVAISRQPVHKSGGGFGTWKRQKVNLRETLMCDNFAAMGAISCVGQRQRLKMHFIDQVQQMASTCAGFQSLHVRDFQII